METKRTRLWRRKQGFRVFKARMVWCTTHHLSVIIGVLTAANMFLNTGLNWQRNIGHRSIVQQERHVVVGCVAAMSTIV